METPLQRMELLIGENNLEILKRSTVMVVGVGGVGSYAAEALARSGVGTLILVDGDTVAPSNLNRQIHAVYATIGRSKTEVMKERIRDINPEICVKTYEMFVLPDNLEELILKRPDYVIDAIDTVTAKIAIAELTKKHGIPLISSMGTGNKLHPELFEITDLPKTSVCPLCKVMRRELKARGIRHLKVLYSKETPVDTSGRETGEDKGMRRALPGSISFTPPVAGLLIAGEVIRELAGVS